jgi:hypothetical protein
MGIAIFLASSGVSKRDSATLSYRGGPRPKLYRRLIEIIKEFGIGGCCILLSERSHSALLNRQEEASMTKVILIVILLLILALHGQTVVK